jgi:N6-L-threonylcarbamoyladenine synthase
VTDRGDEVKRLARVLEQAQLTVADVDAVAVTRGPGLGPCLSVGLNAAKTLAAVAHKPLLGVHHMVGPAPWPPLPAWGAPHQDGRGGPAGGARADAAPDPNHLGVSVPVPACERRPYARGARGRPTRVLPGGVAGRPCRRSVCADGLIERGTCARGPTQLATTRDDSVGDALDKVARALRLPWLRLGGLGASLEAAAAQGRPGRYPLPQPMLGITGPCMRPVVACRRGLMERDAH